jgi:transposase
MQGRKHFSPQLFYQTSLPDLVPIDNYYRILQNELDLQFIYKATQKYYGSEGQESIDPVVFFKILLVGYLNNINSYKQLIAFCSDSLSICLFLGYDSIHKEHYDRMHQKLTQNEKYAKKMSRIRSKTVEPVIGTLVTFTNMKRVNTRGIENANKHVLMASLTYNLKKYLRFVVKNHPF